MQNNVRAYGMWMIVGCLVLVSLGVQAQSANQIPAGNKGVAKVRVSFNPTVRRDPTLSPDDLLLIEYREKQRLAAIEAERKRKEEEERKRREEAERKRQWELMLAKDPSILIRNKIRISGIIDKEVLIGDKLYTIGNTYYVGKEGAKIVAVGSDSVTFLYKGQRFVRKLELK